MKLEQAGACTDVKLEKLIAMHQLFPSTLLPGKVAVRVSDLQTLFVGTDSR